MKIKQIVLMLAATISFNLAINGSVALAATCAGVTTSIIGCDNQYKAAACDNSNDSVDPNTGKCYDTTGCSSASATPSTVTSHSCSDVMCKDGSVPSAAHKCEDGTVLNGYAPAIKETTTSGLWGLLLIVINILTAGIGIAAVGGIIYGAVLYSSSAGNSDAIKKAKDIIQNVVIGLVAYALMYSVLNFLIPGGIFN